jgi:hypothetical protein
MIKPDNPKTPYPHAMMNKKTAFFTILANTIFIRTAFADVVWPALFLETRIMSWWAISLGLLIEYLFIRSFLKVSIKQSLKITLVMNLASCLLGIILTPLSGILWEIFPGILLYKIFDLGTFNPGTWTATFIMSVFINGGIEALVITKVFKTKIGKKGFWLLCAINALSIGAAFISLFIFPAYG